MRTTRVLPALLLCASASAVGTATAAAAGSPQTGTTPCSAALGTTCDPATDAAFQRWGGNLPLLTQANVGPYGDPASYPGAMPDLAALNACRLVGENPGTPDGERAWFGTFMAQLHPDANLGDFHDLFDASMTVVCPDLGYVREFVWDREAGSEDPSHTLEIIVPGEPTWAFTSCAAALGAEPCSTGGFAPLYERWGARLPFLYNDPDGDYVGPSIGATYESDDVSVADVNMTALSLCYTMLTGASIGAVGEWFDAQSARYPAAEPAEHLLFFYYTMTRVCPEVELPG